MDEGGRKEYGISNKEYRILNKEYRIMKWGDRGRGTRGCVAVPATAKQAANKFVGRLQLTIFD